MGSPWEKNNKILGYIIKKFAPTQFNIHVINMEMGSKERKTCPRSCLSQLSHSIIGQLVFVECFLGIALRWVLWNRHGDGQVAGGRGVSWERENEPHSWHQKTYVLIETPMLPPPYPCQRSQLNLWPLVNKCLELSLLLERNSGLRRSTCAGAPSSSQSHVSYILSHFLCMIALCGGNYCYLKFSNENVRFKAVKFCKS